MALIRVTASQLRAKAEELIGLNRQFDSQTGELEVCEQKLSAMWEGQAKEAFHQAFARDRMQMANFSALIDKYVSTLLAIAAKYERAEQANIQTASARNYQ